MNFKRFHESKNLFDGTMEVGTITNNGNPNTSTTRIRTVDFMELEAGTYTLNATANSSLETYVFIYDLNNTFIERIPTLWASVPYTFTIANKSKVKFLLAFAPASASATAIVTSDVSNIMLNTGSTPQPYEPYSSEVWHDIPHYIHNTSTDTITTLPAVLYPNAVTATVGLKGNMEQASGVSPTTPIQPSECGERTGNLVENRIITSYGGSIIGSDGAISPSGAYDTWYAKVTAGETYTMSRVNGVYAFYSAEPQNGSASIDGQRYYTDSDGTKTVTIPTGVTYVAMRTLYNGDTPMLNTGETALPYEPYGIKIPILNNSQTTNVYLGEVQSTRKIGQKILKGDENITYGTVGGHSRFSISGLYATSNYQVGYCSHYNYQYANQNYNVYHSSNNSDTNIFIFDDNYTSADVFKAYLAQQYANGTPVCVWYVLANPETAVVNEPLRKIGDYADEVSGITIPTIAGANTISVGTTLQPSEVTVTYKGWHSVTDVHERESGQWD